MGTFWILVSLIIFVCILLVLVVMVQNPKGGGLASGFTGGAQLGGVQRTTNFLEKTTWYLIVALFVACILAGVSNGKTESSIENIDTRNFFNKIQSEYGDIIRKSLDDDEKEIFIGELVSLIKSDNKVH